MSSSQVWSDAVAMARSLDSNQAYYESILVKYVSLDPAGEVVVDIKLVNALVTLLSTLVDATAENVGWSPDELANFLLMEKFKRDMDEVDG